MLKMTLLILLTKISFFYVTLSTFGIWHILFQIWHQFGPDPMAFNVWSKRIAKTNQIQIVYDQLVYKSKSLGLKKWEGYDNSSNSRIDKKDINL